MRRIFVGTLVAVTWASVAFTPVQSSQQSSATGGRANATNPLVGTWKLVGISPAAGSADPTGLMMVDPDRYVGIGIMQAGRQKYAGSEPTPAEAKAAMESFTSYFGTYAVDPAARSVSFHFDGSLDPNLTDTNQKSSFAISGSRLTMKLPLRAKGVEHSLTWERLPDLTTLSPIQRQLVGFWKLVPNEGQNPDGRKGFIIYSSAGYMSVHIMPAGRTKYSGSGPTPDEAKAAMRYTCYFGPFKVNEQDRYVVHQRIGHTIPASIGTNAQRFYEFAGNRLILRFVSTTFTVPTTIQAATSEGREPGTITWERVSADRGTTQNR